MATIKPIDRDLLARCAKETGAIVTAEDHNIYGGLGGAVAEALAATHPCPIEFVGLKDTFGASGEPEELATLFGIGTGAIAEAARRVIARKRQSVMSRFSLARQKRNRHRRQPRHRARDRARPGRSGRECRDYLSANVAMKRMM